MLSPFMLDWKPLGTGYTLSDSNIYRVNIVAFFCYRCGAKPSDVLKKEKNMPRSDQSMDLTCPRVSLMPGYSYCKGGKLNLGWYLLCSRIYSILIITKCLEQMEIAF